MDIIALSSGESELAAVVKGAAEGLGLQAGLRDFGHEVTLNIRSDATAAIGMVKRLGLGRVRHLSVADLWVQQRVRQGGLTMQKWPGTQNPADLMTKNLGRADTERYCDYLSFRSLPGRAVVSPLRQGSWKVHNVVAAPLSS